ncbi:hypothetical protein J5N97_021691 [Dioscorea zingiberensis]|uniref:CCHC-type domain-containing protein n=1 Tax=Dioscorea zingiberensis TaxID=325984 RepID=A0A9D5C9N1_9LILI|nr:hypothetical protein J5N97_021691 [Dioscorea zingiberensis]
MAPLAHLAVYKVCDQQTCKEVDIVAGMDAAIGDGVDVMSISLGSQLTMPFFSDSVAIAAYRATKKGIFMSFAAGNSGPEKSTVTNEAPWVLTVAAGTMDRTIKAVVKLGDGREFEGQSVFQPHDFQPTLLPLDYPTSSIKSFGGNCNQFVKGVKGKVVLCHIAEAGRLTPGYFLKKIGAAAMILMNGESAGYTTLADAHVLPASHVSYADASKILSYFNSSTNATATIIFKGTIIGMSEAPTVAYFSSRGPGNQSPGILKPDILGPGVNVLAAWPFVVNSEEYVSTNKDFNILSGTSMSTPHLSGIAALLKKMHYDWSPAAIKSAIMTTSMTKDHSEKPIKDENLRSTNFFNMGAGHVNPSKAADPGLVFDIDNEEYIAFLCGMGYSDQQVTLITGDDVQCEKVEKISQSELNYPAIITSRGKHVVVNRTVMNVGEATSTYKVEVDLPKEVIVEVTPNVLAFHVLNEKQSYKVSINSSAQLKGSIHGNLKWVADKCITKISKNIGVIEVCGKCRQPGHLMRDCRRIEVCWRCERPGHREAKCLVPSSELGTIRISGRKQDKAKDGKKLSAKSKDTNINSRPEVRREDLTIKHRKPLLEEETQHVSLALDSSMMKERSMLRRCLVVRVLSGMAGHQKVREVVAASFASELRWMVGPCDDGRILIHCPSEKLARKIVEQKEISFPTFTARFTPWSADEDSSEKADGEMLWISGKGLPLTCRGLDTMERLLKPVGDLVHLDIRGAFYAGHFRALIRVRRGRRFPTTIICNAITKDTGFRWSWSYDNLEGNLVDNYKLDLNNNENEPNEPIYPSCDKQDNTKDFDNEFDDEMDEELENAIEREFEAMRIAQLGWEENHQEEDPGENSNKESKDNSYESTPITSAVYKVCDPHTCKEVDIVAGMDAAIGDGVDVMSISLGSELTMPFFFDSVAIAAYRATKKGIFMSFAAGNMGPEKSTVTNEAPWVLTVAAGTMDRTIKAVVKLGDGQEFEGQSVFQPHDFQPTLLPLAYPTSSSKSFEGNCIDQFVKDIKGKVVLCHIGEDGRKAPGYVLKKLGAAAMILMNGESAGYTTLADAHVLPASHVSYADASKILSYFNSSTNATATIIFKGTIIGMSEAPTVAYFSSRGPGNQSPGILKPDILGPGVNVLAAWPFVVSSEESVSTNKDFNILSGTSMSTPHLSGIAALLKKMHYDWSPAAIKSAIMTTSMTKDHSEKPIKDENLRSTNFFKMGAGHVNPSKAADPGLVFDIDNEEYIAFLCGMGYDDKQVTLIIGDDVQCKKVEKISQSELNYPAIITSSGKHVVVNRTVTNVGEATSTYKVEVDLPKEVIVEVTPNVLEFHELNEKQSYKVSINSSAQLKGGIHGNLKWVADKYTVRTPIIVK